VNNNSRIVIRREPGVSSEHLSRNAKRMLPAKLLWPTNKEGWTPNPRRALLLRARTFGLKQMLPKAAVSLDERDLWTFVGSLRVTQQKKWPRFTDALICECWDEFDINDALWNQLPGLCSWTAQAASAFVSFCSYRRGVPYQLSGDAYRKRIERLRQAGLDLELRLKGSLSVRHAEFERPSTLIVTVTKL